jgi:hypothetical protein
MLSIVVIASALAFSGIAMAQEEAGEPAAAETVESAPAEEASGETQPAPEPAPASPAPKSSGKGLIIGGWIWFGAMWVPSLIYGIATAAKYSLGGQALHILPVIGPIALGAMSIAAGGIYEDAGGQTPAGTIAKVVGVIHIIWGLLEAGALTMAVVGHVRYARYRASLGGEFDNPLYENQKVGFRLAPMGTADGAGLGLVGYF